MQTCAGCGLVSPDSAAVCECGRSFSSTEEPARVGEMAGFWIRLAADLLDAVFLGIFGWVLTLVFGDLIERLGERGVLIGLSVSMVYAGVLQSRVGGGQTMGKRILQLRVVRLDGSLLSLDRSLVRWGLVGFLFYGSAAVYFLNSTLPFLGVDLLGGVAAGLQLSLFLGCAVLVPFHPLKRGLHDLLTDSIVVRKGMPPKEVIPRATNPERDRRLVIAAVSLAVVVAGASAAVACRPQVHIDPELRVIETMKGQGIQSPGVTDFRVSGPNSSKRYVIASGHLGGRFQGATWAEAHKATIAAIRKELVLDGVDSIGTELRTGVNIGIFRNYTSNRKMEPIHDP